MRAGVLLYHDNYCRVPVRVNHLVTSAFVFVIPPRAAETPSCPQKGVQLKQHHLSPSEAHTCACTHKHVHSGSRALTRCCLPIRAPTQPQAFFPLCLLSHTGVDSGTPFFWQSLVLHVSFLGVYTWVQTQANHHLLCTPAVVAQDSVMTRREWHIRWQKFLQVILIRTFNLWVRAQN